MSTKPHTVSIGLPVYNSEQRIRRALDSVLSQDFTDFELVISDNASTDGTSGICQRYAQQDSRVRYFRNETNVGVNANHVRAFKLSRGRYFAWFADDAEYLPGMLSRCVQAMETAPASVALLYPRCEMIRDGQATELEQVSVASSDPRPYKRLEAVVRRIVMVNQLYGLMRRETLAKTRLHGSFPSSDYVLVAELAMQGEIREMPDILIRRRIDSDRGTMSVRRDAKRWKAWAGCHNKGFKDAWLPNRERLGLEYFCAACRAQIKPTEKLLCMAFVLPHYYGRTSRTGRRVVNLLNRWRRNPKAPAKALKRVVN